MTLAPIPFPPAADNSQMLDVLDKLRQEVVEGKVIAFIGVGIEADDQTTCWSATSRSVTRLRVMGAVAHMQACLHAGEV